MGNANNLAPWLYESDGFSHIWFYYNMLIFLLTIDDIFYTSIINVR